MEWKEILTSVKEMVVNSKEEVEGVDYVEVGKYLAVTMSREDIRREGLANVVPERREETDREISGAYLCNKDNIGKWETAKKQVLDRRRRW